MACLRREASVMFEMRISSSSSPSISIPVPSKLSDLSLSAESQKRKYREFLFFIAAADPRSAASFAASQLGRIVAMRVLATAFIEI